MELLRYFILLFSMMKWEMYTNFLHMSIRW